MTTNAHTAKSSMHDLQQYMNTIELHMQQSDKVLRKKDAKIKRVNLNDTQVATVNNDLTQD